MDAAEMKVVKGLKVDPLLFTYKFFCRCNGECCEYGVYTDFKEYEKILSIKDEILPLQDASQTCDVAKWFEAPVDDADFESGKAVGTELFNDKCVFLNAQGHCSIQKLSMQKGEYKWKNKPVYCVLFPVTVYEGILSVDTEHIDRLKYCNKHREEETTIFEYCREELVYLLGEDGYAELEAVRDYYLKTINLGTL